MRLIVEEIDRSFGTKEVLKKASYTFEQGEVYALLGRNGAGKTTLFSIIANELPADAGRIWLEEAGERRALQTADLFFMISEPVLPGFLTGREFLRFFMDANRAQVSSPRPLEEYLAEIGLEADDADRLIQSYSTGMKNKLQMLMFLILKPKVILMDEPLTSLDVVVQLQIKKLIRSIRGEHIILLSTHILQLAEDLCDRMVLLHRGQLEDLQRGDDASEFERELIEKLTQEADGETHA